MSKAKPDNDNVIVTNKKAHFDYFIEERIEAGLVLNGWEVKSLREKKVQLVDCYILFKSGEAFLLGCHINPLQTASTHVTPDPTRTRKLLLHTKQISKLMQAKERDGYAVIPTKLYWARGRAKAEIALAKGKKQYDKRATAKERDWNRDKARVLKTSR